MISPKSQGCFDPWCVGLPGLKTFLAQRLLWLFEARRADRTYAGGVNHRSEATNKARSPKGCQTNGGAWLMKAVSIHGVSTLRAFAFFFIRATGALRTPAEGVSAFQA